MAELRSKNASTPDGPWASIDQSSMDQQQRRIAAAGRKRIPEPAGIMHLTLRAGALVASFVFLIFIAILTFRHNETYPVAYVAALWAIFVDTAEIAALTSKSHSVVRIPPGAMAMLDVFSFLLFAPGAVANLFLAPGAYNYEPDRHPWTPEEEQANAWFWKCIWVGCAVAYVLQKKYSELC
ncbi:hypothetical protein V492_05759 [Pseudogymnoascus sp. VKM F-4246]|nr:hypothetical protein V492_05759 [Pseudogymnoascus sp. VKM F-4246]